MSIRCRAKKMVSCNCRKIKTLVVFRPLWMSCWPLICQIFLSWIISSHFQPQRTFLSQGKSCNQCLAKWLLHVICMQVQSVTDIKFRIYTFHKSIWQIWASRQFILISHTASHLHIFTVCESSTPDLVLRGAESQLRRKVLKQSGSCRHIAAPLLAACFVPRGQAGSKPFFTHWILTVSAHHPPPVGLRVTPDIVIRFHENFT